MPAFSWQESVIEPRLEQLQSSLNEVLPGSADLQSESQTQVHIDTLVQTALRSSEIEGEVLNARSVRSSVVNKLGLQTAGFTRTGHPSRELSGLVQKGCLQKLPGGGRSTRYQLVGICVVW